MVRFQNTSQTAGRGLSLIVVFLLLAISATVRAQQLQTKAEPLEANQSRERKLAGGETHLYEIHLVTNQFLRLNVEQKGVDIALTVYGPEGSRTRDVDNRQGERGLERASIIARQEGNYRIEVRAMRKTALPGDYQISFSGLSSADEQARAIDAAEQLLGEGNALRAQSTKESVTQALAKYREALLLSDSAGDLQLKALLLNRIGRVQLSLGENQQAFDSYQQSLAIARSASDMQAEAAVLTSIGEAYRVTAKSAEALTYAGQALAGWQAIQDRQGEVTALNILGRIYFQLGDQYQALASYDPALQLARIISDKEQEVDVLAGMGLSTYVLGENEKAADIWKQELSLIRSGFQTGREANVLAQLGAVLNVLGDREGALAYLNQAVKLARDRGDRIDEAASLQTIGRVYRSMGEPRKSIEYLNQSLVVLEGVKNPQSSVARAHYNLGKAYTDLREFEKAIDYLNQALVFWKAKNDPINIASTVRELARAESGRGNLEVALSESEAALKLIELLRSRAGGPEARATYLASVEDYFALKVDILTRLHRRDPSKGYAAEALQTSERARARSLLETLAEAGVDVRRGVPSDLLKEERIITEELSQKASERAHLAGTKSTDASLVEVNQALVDLSARYERIEAQIRATSPRYAELLQSQPLSAKEIREQIVDGETVLLEYYLGEERSYLWTVTAGSIETYELPKRTIIEAAARQVYELFTARNRTVKFETAEERRNRIARADAEYPLAARTLSRMVLEPVKDQLTKKRILLVSDGALQYVPFAALPAPGSATYEPLAATNEVVSLPSASTLAVLRREVATRQPAPKTIAVLADPVFNEDDQRVGDSLAKNKLGPANTTSVARRQVTAAKSEIQRSASESGWEGETVSLARLPFTRKEAEAIAALVPSDSRKEGLDFAASLSNATAGELAQYRVVHFATHGFLNSRHPELSGIVLSLVDEKGRELDGFLRAHRIYEMRLPAELIVLSGCRTGLGKEIKGEGLIGLTRAFMHAGAARVLVSLWDVHDEATAELMTRFYSRLLGPEKLSPAAALRAAQVSMLKDKRWANPYYWAGFTLQGEPR